MRITGLYKCGLDDGRVREREREREREGAKGRERVEAPRRPPRSSSEPIFDQRKQQQGRSKRRETRIARSIVRSFFYKRDARILLLSNFFRSEDGRKTDKSLRGILEDRCYFRTSWSFDVVRILRGGGERKIRSQRMHVQGNIEQGFQRILFR